MFNLTLSTWQSSAAANHTVHTMHALCICTTRNSLASAAMPVPIAEHHSMHDKFILSDVSAALQAIHSPSFAASLQIDWNVATFLCLIPILLPKCRSAHVNTQLVTALG